MVVDDRRAAQGTLLFRRLLLEDVAREGVPAAHLAGGGDFEALLRAGVGLHLGHDRERTIMARPGPRDRVHPQRLRALRPPPAPPRRRIPPPRAARPRR